MPEDDLTPGFDEMPDGEIRPDSSLSVAEVTELLRIEASDPGVSTSCGPGDVTGAVEYVDAALGHRYGRLVLTNTSGSACSVSGYPGIGARGEWGNAFRISAEHHEPIAAEVTAGQVTLAPGAVAFADLEWSGELAGAESEKASMLVVQLAADQDAFGVSGVDSNPASGGEPLDIGMLTTVRIGPMQQAEGR